MMINRSLMLELVDRTDVIFRGGRTADRGEARLHHRDQHQGDGTGARAGRPQAQAAAPGFHLEVYGKLDKPRFCEDDDVILGPTSRAR